MNSIRARMTLAFSLSLALFLTLVCVGLIFYAHRDASHNAQETLIRNARKVESELGAIGGNVSQAEILEEERDMASENLTMTMIDETGKRVSGPPDSPPLLNTHRDDWLVRTIPLGKNTVVLGLPWWKTEAVLHRQALFLVLLSGIVLMSASGGAWLLVGRTLSPIDQLTKQAQKASVQTLSVRLDSPSQDAEMVSLVSTLNGLLERLSESAASRGRFYAAASHELRTPLQALSGHLELALTRPRTGEEYKATVEEADAQTKRLTSLVRDLLLLNQLESGSAPEQNRIDLTQIIEESLRLYAPVINAKGLKTSLELPPDTIVLAPYTHVKMLIRNLTENAVKYADRDGELQFILTTEKGTVEFIVFNTCDPLLNPSEVERLFEPFYRLDASRNSETGGNGLGLAICKAIVDANDWKISLERMAHGVKVVVEMPEGEKRG